MNCKIFLALLFLLLAFGSIFAQTKRPVAPKPKDKSAIPTNVSDADKDAKIKELQAEVEELKRQLNEKQEPKDTASPATGSLELEAGLVFNSGDVKPVGRATFYLLKQSADSLIRTRANFDLFTKDKRSKGLSLHSIKDSKSGAFMKQFSI